VSREQTASPWTQHGSDRTNRPPQLRCSFTQSSRGRHYTYCFSTLLRPTGETLFELCRSTPVLPINSFKVFGKAQRPMNQCHRHNPRVPMGTGYPIGLVEDAVVRQGPDPNSRGRGNSLVVFFNEIQRLLPAGLLSENRLLPHQHRSYYPPRSSPHNSYLSSIRLCHPNHQQITSPKTSNTEPRRFEISRPHHNPMGNDYPWVPPR
jgi:hypothetical protein